MWRLPKIVVHEIFDLEKKKKREICDFMTYLVVVTTPGEEWPGGRGRASAEEEGEWKGAFFP